MTIFIIILLILIIIALAIINIKNNNQSKDDNSIDENMPYNRKYLLTKNEWMFYKK